MTDRVSGDELVSVEFDILDVEFLVSLLHQGRRLDDISRKNQLFLQDLDVIVLPLSDRLVH